MDASFEALHRPVRITGWLLVAALIAFRLLPGLAQPGMFFDGLTHAAIARNMAAGVGDFWHPVFSPADGAGYHEQPPLGFWLESLLFRVCGDHFWVEKLYAAATGLLTGLLIAAIWRRLLRDDELRLLDWLPVALWVGLPGWGWMYGNNMLENTLGLFSALAVYSLLRASDGPAVLGRLAWLAAGAGAIMAGVLGKGPVGLFPLITPLVVHFTLRRQSLKQAVFQNVALVAFVAVGFIVLLLLPAASAYLDKYLHEQLFASLAGDRETVSSPLGRLEIVWKIAKEIIVPIAIGASVIWWARRRGGSFKYGWPGLERSEAPEADAPNDLQHPTVRGPIAFCLITGAAGSLPLVLSPKQSGHYAFPSYALYALAIALWCGPAVFALFAREAAVAKKLQRAVRLSSTGVMAALVIPTCLTAGNPHKDADVYRDTLAVGRILPRATVVGLAAELSTDYPLLTSLSRWDDIGADRAAESPRFVLAATTTPPRSGYVAVPTCMSRYRLLQRADLAAGHNR